MSISESIRLALGSIRANKLRSILTMLGIIIGISSVITITTIGNSLQQTISNTFSDLGGTNLISAYVEAVYPEDDEDWETWEYPEMSEEDLLSFEDLQTYKDEFQDEVKYVIAQNQLGVGSVEGEKYKSNVFVVGSTPGWVDANKLKLVKGRDISERDNTQIKATALVSDLFVKYALNNEEPLGRQIDISLDTGEVIKVYVVGVYHYDAARFGTQNSKKADKDIQTGIIVPLTYVNRQSVQESGIESFDIVGKDGGDPTKLAEKTEEYFNGSVYGQNEDFQVSTYDLASDLSVINSVLNVITVAISVIAAISLIVGGVGVMNIMLVSVVERTKEIGIRKALGAKNRNIHLQFLTESVVICLIGGLIGILIGILNGFIIAKIAAWAVGAFASDISSLLSITVRPSLAAIFISVGFSMLTGVLFGSYPANRAAKMSPIDALRYE